MAPWLLRAVAGSPHDVQIMYGVAGERRLDEYEIPWLPGYEGATPVRVGNAAVGQLQLDVYGEVLDAFYVARRAGRPARRLGTSNARSSPPRDDLARAGRRNLGGPRRPQHFTHSKVMAWVAFDRAVRSIEEFDLSGPLDRWRSIRSAIHDEVCARGFDPARNTFVQFFGATTLDASLLLIPLVGFLPADDPRVHGTVAAIERGLVHNGLVMRYDTGTGTDGLPPGEGAFLACSFWLADNYAMLGRDEEARNLFERLLALRNDVGLLAEEYDPSATAPARQFSAGLLASRADQYGPQSGERDGSGRTALAPGRRDGTCGARRRCPSLIRGMMTVPEKFVT